METDGRSNQLGPNYVQVWAALKTDCVQTNPRKNCLCGPTNISAIEITKNDGPKMISGFYTLLTPSSWVPKSSPLRKLVTDWSPTGRPFAQTAATVQFHGGHAASMLTASGALSQIFAEFRVVPESVSSVNLCRVWIFPAINLHVTHVIFQPPLRTPEGVQSVQRSQLPSRVRMRTKPRSR